MSVLREKRLKQIESESNDAEGLPEVPWPITATA